LRASAADWNFSMRALMRSLISDALMDISILLRRHHGGRRTLV
jgi:hypothetical protein